MPGRHGGDATGNGVGLVPGAARRRPNAEPSRTLVPRKTCDLLLEEFRAKPFEVCLCAEEGRLVGRYDIEKVLQLVTALR